MSAISRMVDKQEHRGPDERGCYVDATIGCALGHNRLSILDLSSAGHQPMANADERMLICYNGEVYNFPELRAELEGNRSFSSHSDTEVILAAYERWGTDAFHRLNGMFSFALLDRTANRLLLVRDRLGIKPLYYSVRRGQLLFSSELKGLFASGMLPRTVNTDLLNEYLHFGNILGKNTFYKDIEQLPPGCWLSMDLKSGVASLPLPYWSGPRNSTKEYTSRTDKGVVEKTRALLESAVKRQLASDVPVGAFLSGGIDSSAIVALASRHYGQKLRTYTVGFDYIGDGEELPQARRVAELFQTDHHELLLSANGIEASIERLAMAHDQPFADPANLPLFQLCQALGHETKVILQGDGGDELFGGYRRYEYLRLGPTVIWLAKLANGGLDLLDDQYGKRAFGAHRFFHALSRSDPAERMGLLLSVEGPLNPPSVVLNADLRELVDRQDPFRRYREVLNALPPLDELQRMLHTDLQILLPDIFLQKVDRATMATSTEVRVPFLDFELVDFVTALPSHSKVGIGRRKQLLRAALEGIVPADVLSARKTGFGVPIASWLAGPLRKFAEDRILAQTGSGGWFNGDAVRILFDDHAGGRRDHAQILWKTLQLALWRENLESETIAAV